MRNQENLNEIKIGITANTPGHIDKNDFLDCLDDRLPAELLSSVNLGQVKHWYASETPSPLGIVRSFHTRPKQGLRPVTVLDLGYDAK